MVIPDESGSVTKSSPEAFIDQPIKPAGALLDCRSIDCWIGVVEPSSACRKSSSGVAQAVTELNGDRDTVIKDIGLRESEKLHEELYDSENVITSLKSGSSQDVEEMDLEEIKELLRENG